MESIIKIGLKPFDSKLPDGTLINTFPGHYSLDDSIAGVKNWGRAIFVSPSIFYSSHACYAERIMSNSERWLVLVETRIKPDCFTRHILLFLNINLLKRT